MQKITLPVRPSNVPPIQIVDGKFIADIGTTRRIPLHLIIPNLDQPRKYFDPEEQVSTAQSYSHRGDVEKPLDVCIRTTPEGTNYAFIIDGESRFRAAKLPIAKLEHISCYIQEDPGNDEIFLSSAISNIRRRDFSVIEKALAIFELQQRFNLDENTAGALLGMEPTTVSYLMPFLDLHEKIQRAIMEGRLGVGVARLLVKHSLDDQLFYLKKIVEAVKENGGKTIHHNKVARILRGEAEKRGHKSTHSGQGRVHSTQAQLVTRNLLSKSQHLEDALKEFDTLDQKTIGELKNPHFLDVAKALQDVVRKAQKQLERLSRHA